MYNSNYVSNPYNANVVFNLGKTKIVSNPYKTYFELGLCSLEVKLLVLSGARKFFNYYCSAGHRKNMFTA